MSECCKADLLCPSHLNLIQFMPHDLIVMNNVPTMTIVLGCDHFDPSQQLWGNGSHMALSINLSGDANPPSQSLDSGQIGFCLWPQNPRNGSWEEFVSLAGCKILSQQ